jgi:hypothetical protein
MKPSLWSHVNYWQCMITCTEIVWYLTAIPYNFPKYSTSFLRNIRTASVSEIKHNQKHAYNSKQSESILYVNLVLSICFHNTHIYITQGSLVRNNNALLYKTFWKRPDDEYLVVETCSLKCVLMYCHVWCVTLTYANTYLNSRMESVQVSSCCWSQVRILTSLLNYYSQWQRIAHSKRCSRLCALLYLKTEAQPVSESSTALKWRRRTEPKERPSTFYQAYLISTDTCWHEQLKWLGLPVTHSSQQHQTTDSVYYRYVHILRLVKHRCQDRSRRYPACRGIKSWPRSQPKYLRIF